MAPETGMLTAPDCGCHLCVRFTSTESDGRVSDSRRGAPSAPGCSGKDALGASLRASSHGGKSWICGPFTPSGDLDADRLDDRVHRRQRFTDLERYALHRRKSL